MTHVQSYGEAGVVEGAPGRNLGGEVEEWDNGKGGEEGTEGEEESQCAIVRKKYHLHRTTPDRSAEAGMKSRSCDVITHHRT